jgi:hypothetical protein
MFERKDDAVARLRVDTGTGHNILTRVADKSLMDLR